MTKSAREESLLKEGAKKKSKMKNSISEVAVRALADEVVCLFNSTNLNPSFRLHMGLPEGSA